MAEQNQPEEVNEQQVPPTQSVRTAVEEEIASRVNAEVLAENPQEPAEATETPEATAEAPAPETPAEPAVEAPETVEVKIEGQVFQVPKSKVDEEGGLEAFQKKAAAELIFRRAKQREEEANKLLAAARNPQPNQPDTRLVDAITKIRFGENPEEAAMAVRELVGANQLTPEQINQIADQRYAHRRAVEKFQERHPEIVSDPILHHVAANMENHLLAQGRRDFDQMFTEIGKSLSDWRGKLSGNFKEKQEKKATVTNIPQAKAKASLPETPREPTVAEIIAQERKARKQM